MFQFRKSSIALCHLAASLKCTVWMLLQSLLAQEMFFFKKIQGRKPMPGMSAPVLQLLELFSPLPALPPLTFLLPLPHLPVSDLDKKRDVL